MSSEHLPQLPWSPKTAVYKYTHAIAKGCKSSPDVPEFPLPQRAISAVDPNGKLVGVVSFGLDTEDGLSQGYIANLWVHHIYRRKGHGTSLVKLARGYYGAKTMFTLQSFRSAIPFWKTLGASLSGWLPVDGTTLVLLYPPQPAVVQPGSWVESKTNLCLVCTNEVLPDGEGCIETELFAGSDHTGWVCSDECYNEQDLRYIAEKEIIGRVTIRLGGFRCVLCESLAKKKCSRCLVARYCTSVCQRKDWARHKQSCPVSSNIQAGKLPFFSTFKKQAKKQAKLNLRATYPKLYKMFKKR
jgi:hypothetical protein